MGEFCTKTKDSEESKVLLKPFKTLEDIPNTSSHLSMAMCKKERKEKCVNRESRLGFHEDEEVRMIYSSSALSM